MALVGVFETIKLEPSVIKLEPPVVKLEPALVKLEPPVVKSEPSDATEIYPACVFLPSVEEVEDKKIDISECKVSVADVLRALAEEDESNIAVENAEREDGRGDNDFCATDIREDEHLGLNFNHPIVPIRHDDKPKESGDNEKINWAIVYKTRQTTNCLEEERKVTKIYGSSWNEPIREDEYTYISKTSIICNYCHREFKGIYILSRHIRVIHREASIIHQCPYCPKQSKWSLASHILTQHKDESEVNWFQCYECNKKFRMKNYLAEHIQTHLGTKWDNSFPCPTCGRIFTCKRSMQKHIVKEHERKFQCEKCNFTAPYLGVLKKHIEERHTNPKELTSYQCSKCDYKTRRKDYYYRHSQRHENKYFCDKCTFMTQNLAQFKLHANDHKTRLHCKNCDYITYQPYKLQLHEVRHLKPEEINFLCCYHCDFKTKRRGNLKTHVIRHFKKEEVALQCFICEFETKKRGELTEHMNRHQKSSEIKEESV